MALSLKKIDRQRWLTFVTHLLVICMLFFLPEIMMSYSNPRKHISCEWVVYAKAALFVGVFYIEYYLIITKTLLENRHRFLAFTGWNLLLIAIVMGLIYWLQHYEAIIHMPKRHKPLDPAFVFLRQWAFLLRDFGMVILTIALSVALKLGEDWAAIAKRNEQMIASQRADELTHLKSQLNPHFLFNTLNTIYSLIEISPKEAQQAVHRLSHLLRYVLYENPQKVSLSQEIDFVRNYIALMEMRLGSDTVNFYLSVEPAQASKIEIAPLLFITLVENAFKHGNTGDKSHKIDISITADDHDTVTCSTSNHFVASSRKSTSSGGIGIGNLRRRLQLIYGDKASLQTHIHNDIFTTTLTVNTR